MNYNCFLLYLQKVARPKTEQVDCGLQLNHGADVEMTLHVIVMNMISESVLLSSLKEKHRANE